MNFKSFFYLQKNDRQGVIIMLLLAVIAVLFVVVFSGGDSSSSALRSGDVGSGSPKTAHSSKPVKYYQVEGRRAELFYFDPNTADSTQFLRLGLQPWQVRNIYKYRAAGGIYRQPSDFARLYGLTVKQYREMRPFIRISRDYLPAADYYGQERNVGSTQQKSSFHRDSVVHREGYIPKLHAGQHVSINEADTSELQKILGIGSAYARAIVNYRDRLGGFATVRQVLDIGGVPESALHFMKVSESGVHHIAINQLTLNQLRRHPYINFYQARAICDFRRLHGPISSLQQLSNLTVFTSEDIARLEPYIEY